MILLWVPLLGLLSLLNRDTFIFRPLLFLVLVGLPLGLAIALEWWLGTRDEER